jgi:hypothetical protein
MPLILFVLVLLLIAAILHHIFHRVPRLPTSTGGWGLGSTDDPRVALAAMLYSVATEHGPITPEQERHILSLLASKVGLELNVARTCLTGGKRVARYLRGDLNSRLHQLSGPIERKCSQAEKQDVIDMLHLIAGTSAVRIGPVRDGLGRLSATLLRG